MRRIALAAALPALVASLLAVAPPARAATGLDPTYGDGGVATVLGADEGVPVPGLTVFGAIDPQGRVVRSLLSPNQLVRLTADGEPDPSFGDDGLVDLAFGGGPVDATVDGIVVADQVGDNVGVVRLDVDGDVVESFGDGGLAVAQIDPPGELVTVLQVVLGADGAATVASRWDLDGNDEHLVVQRFDADGDLVTDFNGAGAVVRDIDFPTFEGLGVDDSGITFVANHANGEGGNDDTFDVLRLRLDGTLDPGFGEDGTVTMAGGATSLELDDRDGGVVLGGATHLGPKVWRLGRDGRADARFASGDGLPDGGAYVPDLAVLGQGRVAAAVWSADGIRPVVLGPDGAIDAGFAAAAPVPTGFGALSGIIGPGTGERVLVATSNVDSDAGEARAYLTDFADLGPTVTEVTPYETSLSVEWTAPGAGHPVRTYYLVAWHDEHIAGYAVVAGDVRQASIEGLDPVLESYEVTVLPYDDFGPVTPSGPFDVPSVASAPAAGPAPAVPGVAATAGNGFATVSWDPPFDGGSTIWGYSVVAVRHDTGALAGWRNVRADVRTAAMPELANGTAYDLYVFAVTSEGFSTVGSAVPVTPSPAGPTKAAPQMDWVSAVPISGAAVVTWGPPTERGEVATAVHVIVLEDGAITDWKAVTAFERQVVVSAAPGAQLYVVGQSASGFGPLTGPIAVD